MENFYFVAVDFCADKTSIGVCMCSYWLQLFMHKFRDRLAYTLKWNHFSSAPIDLGSTIYFPVR